MNNKGQTLVIFVLLLPLFVLLLAFITDTSIMFFEKNRLDNTSRMIINYKMNHIEMNDKKVREYIKKNDKEIKVEKLKMDDKKVVLKTSKKINSVFGKIIGKDYYIVSSYYEGIINTKQINKIEE